MKEIQITLTSSLVALLLVGSANAQLNTSIGNGDFSINGGGFWNPVVSGWLEHEVYSAGAGIWGPQVIPGVSGSSLSLISGDASANTATVMQSLGTIGPSDVGQSFTLNAGAVAWDWYPTVKPFSGTVTLSFRTGCAPDSSFNYGSLLGTAGSVVTGVTVAGDGAQNGIGDDGGLQPLIAAFTPTAGDVGTQVFAVINLGNGVWGSGGENRFVVDNVTLAVTTIPEPSVLALLGLGLLGLWRRR